MPRGGDAVEPERDNGMKLGASNTRRTGRDPLSCCARRHPLSPREVRGAARLTIQGLAATCWGSAPLDKQHTHTKGEIGMAQKVRLRDYQTECISAIDSELGALAAKGLPQRTLVVMATGTGKTVVFLSWLDRFMAANPQGRALIVAHRRELIWQPVERAQEMFPNIAHDMGVVMAEHDQANAKIVVGTVQSLTPARLGEVLRHGPINVCIIDECHHATARTYLRIIEALPQDAIVLGFTATPVRTDRDGLSKVFASCAFRFPIDAAVEQGALAPFDALGFSVPVSMFGIKETDEGWDDEAVGDLLRAGNVLDIIYSKWRETGGVSPTLAFAASVAQAHDAAAYFQDKGVAAEAVDGTTPKPQREAILSRFSRGETKVLWNCQVLTEGYDCPEVACIIMAAPTKSDLVYVQRLGRGLRKSKNKKRCLVLDFAPAERNVVVAGDVLGKPRVLAMAEERAESAGIMLGGISVDQFGLVSSIDPSLVVAEWLDLLSKTPLAWSVQNNLAVATLSSEAMLVIVMPDAARAALGEKRRRELGDKWTARHERLLTFVKRARLLLLSRKVGRWQAELLGEYEDDSEAYKAARKIARELTHPTLGEKSRRWRALPATEAQRRVLEQMGLWQDGISRGRASQIIALQVAQRVTNSFLQCYEARL